MIDKRFARSQRLAETRQSLARAPLIRDACALDLLVFLYRHPRALLTNEQIAAFVGYGMKQVATTIDAFIDAGLLERNKNPKHAARMYLLLLDGPRGGDLATLLRFASTRQGRQDILELLSRGQAQTAVDAARAKRRLHATA